MITRSRPVLLAAVLSAIFHAYFAMAADAALGCELKKVALARVVTRQAKLYFIAGPGKRTPACPSAERACRRKAFLVRGDEVLVDEADTPYLCATFKSPAGIETSGWLPRAALETVPPKAAPARQWEGKWERDAEAEIEIKSHADDLTVAGTATWGGHDPERVKRGGVHTGELEGGGKPRGPTLAIGYDPDRSSFPSAPDAASDSCSAQLNLYGRYLMVEDNGRCGGVNVSFTGVYVRVSR